MSTVTHKPSVPRPTSLSLQYFLHRRAPKATEGELEQALIVLVMTQTLRRSAALQDIFLGTDAGHMALSAEAKQKETTRVAVEII